jgi:lipoprotein Spr
LQPVPRQALQEGDMVFFKIKRNRISHIGLYLGSHKFLHATTRAGVIISDLDEPYYRKRYFGAGRDPEPPRINPVYIFQPVADPVLAAP